MRHRTQARMKTDAPTTMRGDRTKQTGDERPQPGRGHLLADIAEFPRLPNVIAGAHGVAIHDRAPL